MKYSKISADNYLVKRRDIYIEKFDIGDDSRLHTHDFIEIAYITSGKGRHSLVKSEETVSAGDMIILSPEVPHRLYSHDGRLRGYSGRDESGGGLFWKAGAAGGGGRSVHEKHSHGP